MSSDMNSIANRRISLFCNAEYENAIVGGGADVMSAYAQVFAAISSYAVVERTKPRFLKGDIRNSWLPVGANYLERKVEAGDEVSGRQQCLGLDYPWRSFLVLI